MRYVHASPTRNAGGAAGGVDAARSSAHLGEPVVFTGGADRNTNADSSEVLSHGTCWLFDSVRTAARTDRKASSTAIPAFSIAFTRC